MTAQRPSPTDITANPPNYELSVNNKALPLGLKRLISTVEYESIDGVADQLKVRMTDHFDEKGRLIIRDNKVFQPGNVIALFIGYGPRLTHIGSAVVRKFRQSYPQEGNPSIEIVGYSRETEMADNSPQPPREQRDEQIQTQSGQKPRRKSGQIQGRRFSESKFSDAVEIRAGSYNFELDVDPTPEQPRDFIQKTGLSDYDFVKGISNITGYFFWVDADKDGKWTLHLKDPDKLSPAAIGQKKTYNFKWNEGDHSTILSFEPELALQGQANKLKVVLKDPKTGAVREVDVLDEAQDAPDTIAGPGASGFRLANGNAPLGSGSQLKLKQNVISTDYATPGAIKLVVGDFAFVVKTNRTFTTEDEVARWARNWFKRTRDNFILAKVTLIGVESLRARQVHRLSGLGTALSGEYFFNSVRHIFSNSGYICEANVRKIVQSPPINASVGTGVGAF